MWLFGSRVDNAKRVGDVDHYEETDTHLLMNDCAAIYSYKTPSTCPWTSSSGHTMKTTRSRISTKHKESPCERAHSPDLEKLEHLGLMRRYLDYSIKQELQLLPIQSWTALTPDNHESLAAFRIRFSEFQELRGKPLRAIAIQEEQHTEPYTAALLYMEKLTFIESTEAWKEIRELSKAVSHEYEENAEKLAEFFVQLTQSTPTLFAWHDHMVKCCEANYTA
jgi:hypothetical protein